MKAKEYADLYRANPGHEAMAQIASSYLIEIGTIAEMRHATSDAAMMSIFDEQDQKWRAMARNLGVAPDGFRLIMEAVMPEIYAQWMELRSNNGRPMPKARVPSQLELDTSFWLDIIRGRRPWEQ